jgi:ketosteroid isomerase-like protein
VSLPPTADDLAKASAVLEKFHAAAAAADEEAYFACFADGGVFLGTDATERWTVPQFRAYAHPRFASGKAWHFTSRRRDVSAHGDTAWFDEDLETANLGPARGSGVLVRDAKGDWKIAQYNLSIPIPNARFADVRRAIDGAPAPAAAPPTTPAAAPASASTATKPGHADPPICVAARAAAKRASPSAAGLANQCRAAGGTP